MVMNSKYRKHNRQKILICIHSRLTLEQFMYVTPCYTILIEYKRGWAMDSDIVMNNVITSYMIIL